MPARLMLWNKNKRNQLCLICSSAINGTAARSPWRGGPAGPVILKLNAEQPSLVLNADQPSRNPHRPAFSHDRFRQAALRVENATLIKEAKRVFLFRRLRAAQLPQLWAGIIVLFPGRVPDAGIGLPVRSRRGSQRAIE
ncbi:hypothetical protein HPP92_028452 [Vanilla planifolia]|uniref:Uncharacterized protein n=1 Tax=Vanilla planifolia TaxID=51239 RepID=A0A835P635_VANPL|nr:hypothetical protein HPP92_028452 [Vanilla planifolia]KAG0447229.1 hypothetical protein HPP92_028455 [Vanilla planifolia]